MLVSRGGLPPRGDPVSRSALGGADGSCNPGLPCRSNCPAVVALSLDSVDVSFGSSAAVAGWLMAQPVYPQLRKSPLNSGTYVANKRHQCGYDCLTDKAP